MINKDEINKNATYQGLLRDEIMVLQQIQHPQIMQVVDIVEDNSHYNIITEILEGGPILSRMLEHGAFTEKESKIIMK
jgi:serine/threonine protein kinase